MPFCLPTLFCLRREASLRCDTGLYQASQAIDVDFRTKSHLLSHPERGSLFFLLPMGRTFGHAWVSTDSDGFGLRNIDNADPALLSEGLATGSIGFSFSGGGFFLPYHLGAIRALSELGLVRPGRTHAGGSSAGSLAAAVVTSGVKLDEVVREVGLMMDDCRENGVLRRLGGCVKEKVSEVVRVNSGPAEPQPMHTQLELLLPEDAHVRCSGTIHVAITKVKAYGGLHR